METVKDLIHIAVDVIGVAEEEVGVVVGMVAIETETMTTMTAIMMNENNRERILEIGTTRVTEKVAEAGTATIVTTIGGREGEVVVEEEGMAAIEMKVGRREEEGDVKTGTTKKMAESDKTGVIKEGAIGMIGMGIACTTNYSK